MGKELLILLECPECGKKDIQSQLWEGQSEEKFLKLACEYCGEQGFFQFNSNPNNNELGPSLITVSEQDQIEIQQDWRDWHNWKRRHLDYFREYGSNWAGKYWWLLLIVILSGWGFFFTDQIHMLKGIFENTESRQDIIQSYAVKLAGLPCLSDSMKAKLSDVPILYTRERPYHRGLIQYGEAGIYWGEELIKVHRTNFWFIGLPKRSQLIETLIHEVRHRVSPGLGHGTFFQELVAKDT